MQSHTCCFVKVKLEEYQREVLHEEIMKSGMVDYLCKEKRMLLILIQLNEQMLRIQNFNNGSQVSE